MLKCLGGDMMFYRYKQFIPEIDESAFIADGAKIIGNVKIGADTSVWYNAVLRGDEDRIEIGNRVSIQENVSCHLYEGYPLIVEDDVTVGHNAIIHGCHIKKGALIGMGAIILDGAVIGENSIVGANSFIPTGKVIPPNSLVLGSPAKVVREIDDSDRELLRMSVAAYVQNARDYQNPEIVEKITRDQLKK